MKVNDNERKLSETAKKILQVNRIGFNILSRCFSVSEYSTESKCTHYAHGNVYLATTV